MLDFTKHGSVITIERMLFGDAIEFMFVTITTDVAFNFAEEGERV